MGFFKKLFAAPEPPPKPPKIKKSYEQERIDLDMWRFNEVKKELDPIIATETATLKSLQIPLPREIKTLSMKSDGLIFTEFELPPHITFPFIEGHNNHRVHYNFEWLHKVYSCFFITGEKKEIDLVRDDFLKNGLLYVTKKYEGEWFNRNPYAFYYHLNELPNKLKNKWIGTYHDYQMRPKDWIFSTLEKISYDTQQLEDILQRMTYCTDIAGDFWGFKDKLFLETPIPKSDYFKEELWREIPVPQWDFLSLQCTFKILPSEKTAPSQLYAQFFDSIRAVQSPIEWEIQATPDEITYFLTCAKDDAEIIKRQFELYFPTASITEQTTYIERPLFDNENDVFFTRLAPTSGIVEKLKNVSDFVIEPYQQLFDIIAKEPNQCVSITFTITPFAAESLSLMCNLLEGSKDYKSADGSLSVRERIKRLEGKQSAWALKAEIAAGNNSISKKITSQFFNQYTERQNTTFTPEEQNRHDTAHYIVSNNELSALVRFPTSELVADRLETVSMKSKLPPQLYTFGSTLIGTSEARGQIQNVCLPEEVRDRHLYIVGKSGTGKSTLIEQIALNDMRDGMGVAVIDPHGDMIQNLIKWMPPHRVDDCILFSPKNCPLSLEILAADNEHEIDLLSDDLITMFRRTSEAWGDKMQAILQMTFQTLLRVPGSSFTDITRLLTDEHFRATTLSKIKHPQLTNFWQHRFDMRQAEPILIRMDRLTISQTLRTVLTQHPRSVNFSDVITEGKILLVDLSKGHLGESTSHLLGSIIVSQIQLAAMRQAHLPSEQRAPFSLFVDEVQNFITGAFSTILSEARKYKLRLTVAHQFVSQLPTDIQKALFGNVGTMIFFGMSPDDLGAARHELGQFEPSDIANLPKYQALCRPATAAKDTFSFKTIPPVSRLSEKDFTPIIIEKTQREYGKTEPEAIETKKAIQSPTERTTPVIIDSRPTKQPPPTFATNTEKILHFVRQAEYLSQPQIIALSKLQPSNASTALRKLVETGQIKALDDRRPKIYFIGRTCNPTTHNLMIRDVFTKICASGYTIQQPKFNAIVGDLKPDLVIEFQTENGSPITAFFEIDRGTEGVSELISKALRYETVADKGVYVTFIFEKLSDLKLARKKITQPFISYALLDEFSTLDDAAFYRGMTSENAGVIDTKNIFFGS
jgi:hypothetical protein